MFSRSNYDDDISNGRGFFEGVEVKSSDEICHECFAKILWIWYKSLLSLMLSCRAIDSIKSVVKFFCSLLCCSFIELLVLSLSLRYHRPKLSYQHEKELNERREKTVTKTFQINFYCISLRHPFNSSIRILKVSFLATRRSHTEKRENFSCCLSVFSALSLDPMCVANAMKSSWK